MGDPHTYIHTHILASRTLASAIALASVENNDRKSKSAEEVLNTIPDNSKDDTATVTPKKLEGKDDNIKKVQKAPTRYKENIQEIKNKSKKVKKQASSSSNKGKKRKL